MAADLNEPVLRRVAWWLFVVSVLLHMLLPANVLTALGVPYDTPGGSPVAKIHIGFYVLMLAWLLALSSFGNPLRVMAGQFKANRLLATSLLCMVLVFAWAVYRHGTSGAAYIVQTLWTPAIALFTLFLFDARRSRQLVVFIMAVLGVNAAVAIGESLLRVHLYPVSAGLVGYEYFRASGLMGHPLLNSKVTASLLPAVLLMPWAWGWRIGLATVMLLAMFAFGGRFSIGVLLVIYGTCAVAWLLAAAARGRFSYLQLTGGSFALLAGTTALAGTVAASGLGERVLKNLVWDNSASVRVQVWDALTYLRDTDIWIGIPPAEIDKIALQMGLDPQFEAIENFWIYLYMQFGAVGYVPFIVGLGCLTLVVFGRAPLPMRIGLLMYFVLASAGNSLASKTISLLMISLTAVACSGFVSPRPAARAVRPAARAPSFANVQGSTP